METVNINITEQVERVTITVIENKVAGGGDLMLGETSGTAYRGDRGKIAYDHSQAAHAPSDAQKNSDITKEEIEAKLTGTITSHTHAAAAPAEHASTHVTGGTDIIPNVIAGGNAGLMTGADKTKLDGIETNANNYTHPANHPPSIITQDTNNRFVTDTEKTTWNNKLDASAKASASEINAGTNDTKFVTSKGLADSEYYRIHVGTTAPTDTTMLWLDINS